MSDGYGVSAPNPLTREQTIDLIVKTCLDHGVTDPRQIAYVLATAQHESTNFTKPEEDYGRQQAVTIGYQGGEDYFGRGFAHLTHLDNYRKLGQALGRGEDLVNDPALAADPQIAADVIVIGMRDGLFTERRLDQFIGADAADYEGARQIINGSDRKVQIAALATHWESRVPDLVTRIQRDGVDLTPATAAPAIAALAIDAPLRQGDANARIFELQQYLKALEVTNDAGAPLKPDGDFGPSSAQAVRRYQRNAGIEPPSGIVDQALFDRIKGDALRTNPDFELKSYTELHGPLRDGVLNPGDRGDPVFQLREQLAGLGYLDDAGSKFNSRYDKETEVAVKRFQDAENLEPVDGLANERTRDAINALAVAQGLPETAEVAARREQAQRAQQAQGRAADASDHMQARPTRPLDGANDPASTSLPRPPAEGRWDEKREKQTSAPLSMEGPFDDPYANRAYAALLAGDSDELDRIAIEFSRSAEGQRMAQMGDELLAQQQLLEQQQLQEQQNAQVRQDAAMRM